MLVLSRKQTEVIRLVHPSGELIAEIAVVDIRGDKVRLGIQADRSVGIYRAEVHDALLTDAAVAKGA